MKRMFVVLLILLMVMMLGACTSTPAEDAQAKVDEPTADEPVVEDSATEEPAVEEPAAEEPAAEESTTEVETPAEEPAAEETAVEPAGEDSEEETTATENSEATESEPADDESTSEEPAVEPAEEPQVEKPVREAYVPNYKKYYTEAYVITDPFSEVFDESMLSDLDADGFTGTDREIATQILAWQDNHMIYASNPANFPDVSYPGRWNLFLPGIYKPSEVVEDRIDSSGDIYGICSDYALIYCAIGNSYGLETRASYFTKFTFSEANPWVDPETVRGLSTDEYGALKSKMQKSGFSLTYDQIDRVAREGPVHIRAEVRLDGEWVPFDGVPTVTGDYLVSANYEALSCDYAYSNVLLYAPAAMTNDVLDIDALVELLSYCPQIPYDGITDDHGNTNRAESFINLTRGLGKVPYYESLEDVATFLKLPADQASDILDDVPEVMAGYEAGTGKPFYAIAEFLVYGEEEMSADDYISQYNAITGGGMTKEEFMEYVQ
jgi:hypothetical protein